jgi:hypothetical protein
MVWNSFWRAFSRHIPGITRSEPGMDSRRGKGIGNNAFLCVKNREGKKMTKK